MTIKRRKFVQNLGLAVPVLASPLNSIFANRPVLYPAQSLKENHFEMDFSKLNERVWIGKSFWALGPSDLGRGHRGNPENGRMTFWDAMEPEL